MKFWLNAVQTMSVATQAFAGMVNSSYQLYCRGRLTAAGQNPSALAMLPCCPAKAGTSLRGPYQVSLQPVCQCLHVIEPQTMGPFFSSPQPVRCSTSSARLAFDLVEEALPLLEKILGRKLLPLLPLRKKTGVPSLLEQSQALRLPRGLLMTLSKGYPAN